MSTLFFIRCFFFIISGLVGYYVGTLMQVPLLGAEIGCVSGLMLIFLETRLQRVSVRGLPSMVFGLLLGLFMAKLMADILNLLPLGDFIQSVTRVVLTVVFSYLGSVMAIRGKDEFNIIIPYVRFKRMRTNEGIILVDTSAIIDGRIPSVYKTNFMAGRLVVPRFVLQELQKLADSKDEIKRQRGNRGIEYLREMQKDPSMDVRIQEEEIEPGEAVDSKLVEFAKIMDARVCTTDYNLSRVAMLQGVETLNVNELVHALKPTVFFGQEFETQLVKEGKESGQALGYFEDGTMIVVSGAKKFIGQSKMVRVSSVLQTQSGKIVFADIINQ